jgi:hypothetical protein
MPEFLVWSMPSMIEIVEAESEQDAAEEILGQPVTKSPVLDEPPTCFVQCAGGLEAPRMDGTAIKFWVCDENPPPLDKP